MRLEIDVQPESGCWFWQRGKITAGYGVLWPNGKPQYAHRFVYEAAYGPIPDGLTIDHLCRTPDCINPGHLEAVPHIVNVQRGKSQVHPVKRIAANRFCKRGHWMDEELTYLDSRGRTRCRRCHADRMQRLRRRGELPLREREGATA